MARYGSITTEVAVQKWFHSNNTLSSDETLRLMRWIEKAPKASQHAKSKHEGDSISRRKSAVSDRRSFRPSPDFPFEDQSGVLVTNERRFSPDRRINNIEVEWLL